MGDASSSAANAAILVGEGVSQSYIDSQIALGKGGAANGQYIDPQDMAAFRSGWQTQQNGPQAKMAGVTNFMEGVLGNQYAFDPMKWLPGINQQADSIYDPQNASLNAVRDIINLQADDAKVQTTKQFDDYLQSETESINNRGAYFSGGAIEHESDIRSQKNSALTQIGLNQQLGLNDVASQQAMLAVEKAAFIEDALYNKESSAWNRWVTQQELSITAANSLYSMYADERDFTQRVFEFDETMALNREKYETDKKYMKKNYDMNEEQFKMQQETWELDMKDKNLTFEMRMDKFKQGVFKNSGDLGVDANGNDVYDTHGESYDAIFGGQSIVPGTQISQQSTIIDLAQDSWSIQPDNQ